jgi:hypothetical protein
MYLSRMPHGFGDEKATASLPDLSLSITSPLDLTLTESMAGTIADIVAQMTAQ